MTYHEQDILLQIYHLREQLHGFVESIEENQSLLVKVLGLERIEILLTENKKSCRITERIFQKNGYRQVLNSTKYRPVKDYWFSIENEENVLTERSILNKVIFCSRKIIGYCNDLIDSNTMDSSSINLLENTAQLQRTMLEQFLIDS